MNITVGSRWALKDSDVTQHLIFLNKKTALSLKASAVGVPRKKTVVLLASLENIPVATVLTRARGTANRAALRIDRART